MIHIQDWVHRLEEGGGLRLLRPVLLGLVLLGIVVSYNLRGFHDLSNPEAMDAAQVARNVAQHRGFSTLFIRPFSVYLLQHAAEDRLGPTPAGDTTDRAQVRGLHPDLANPPLYPLLLAGWMKITPADYAVHPGRSIWNRGGSFWVYPPDFFLSLFNQALLFLAAGLVFRLARRLFDAPVAWTSAALFLGTDLFWRFAISGLPTLLLIVIFLLLVGCLASLETGARDNASFGRLAALAAATGLLAGLGALTRYSFLCLVPPVLAFVVLCVPRQRSLLCAIVLLVGGAVITPWLWRNYHLSHTLFGTAGFAPIEMTPQFVEFRLQRSLKPVISSWDGYQVWFKTLKNTRALLQDELPRLGGNWVIAFFFAGLMIRFNNPKLNRLRWFVAGCLPLLVFSQAMGRTQISEASPVLNGENLLILVMPLIIIFGVAVFYVLMDQMVLQHPAFRVMLIGVFCTVTCLPMILTFFADRTMAPAYPPYYPPTIQGVANWMHEDELMMSDIPWAVAWYGKRQCIWTTLNTQEDFFAVYDYIKPVRALYLTPETLDSRFLSQWVRASEHSWGTFILETVNRQQIPANFPLRQAPSGFLPEQFFLTDRERWKQ